MAEGMAAGIAPHELLDYTPRMLVAVFKGNAIKDRRELQASLWSGWNTANFSRAKKLPDLLPLLRKLNPDAPNMTAKELRSTVINMAREMGARVIRVPKKKQ